MNGWNINLGRRSLGVPDFDPSAIFPQGIGFLSFYSLDHKCHSVGAWWVRLVCKANFIEMRAQWATGYILKQEMPTFLSLLSGHVHLKCVIFCQCEGSFFSLSAHEPLLFTRCKISCYAVPAHTSLVIPSYLPAVTPWTFLQWIYRLL